MTAFILVITHSGAVFKLPARNYADRPIEEAQASLSRFAKDWDTRKLEQPRWPIDTPLLKDIFYMKVIHE